MVEEVYKKFEQKRVEALKQPEFKEKELTTEKNKEIIREAISDRLQKTKPLPPAQQKTVAQTSKQIQAQSKERQIKLLTDLAFEKGIPHAIEVAKRLDSPYILDEFHDALVDELYKRLVDEGKLKSL